MKMNLYIKIKDGNPFEHPILEQNFKEAYPLIDTNNLPNNFAKFERIEKPFINLYEVYEGVTYEWFDEIVKDVHHVRNMTKNEKIQKQNEIKTEWENEGGFKSWIFNEETSTFDPPFPYPNDGKQYYWNEETTSWIETI